jgi:hypothetical protein
MAGTKRRTRQAQADLDLRDFTIVGPFLTRAVGGYFGTAASFCLRKAHPRGRIVIRFSEGNTTRDLKVAGHAITPAIRRSFADLQDATEHGAYGVALIAAATQLRVQFAARSFKGTGFDFFLSPPGSPASDPDDIFSEKWGLEVSGILDGGEPEIRDRLKTKRRQVANATKLHPVLVAVVEFSEPAAIFQLLK